MAVRPKRSSRSAVTPDARKSQSPKARSGKAGATPSAAADSPRRVRDEVTRDGILVRACLAGDQQAWEQLYHECHQRLCQAIQYLLWRLGQQDQLTEEIAARVWFALVRDSGRLLARFDAERDCRFGVFLVGLARNEILQYIRSERRRLRRERIGRRLRVASFLDSKAEMDHLMHEFASTLSDRERDFLQRFLLGEGTTDADPDAPEMSDANVWQRRHRIRRKLESFLDSE